MGQVLEQEQAERSVEHSMAGPERPIFRIGPEAIAGIRARRSYLSRWSARLMTWGTAQYPPERRTHGVEDRPVLFRFGPELGPSLAESLPGLQFKRLMTGSGVGGRPSVYAHYAPRGAHDMDAGAFVPEMFSGVIESAHADQYGIVGTILVMEQAAHDDLEELAAEECLWSAGLCLSKRVGVVVHTTPRGTIISDVLRARGLSISLASYPLLPGCRILRRLQDDEELGPDDFEAPARTIVPANWPPAEEVEMLRRAFLAGAVVTGGASALPGPADLSAGAVTTPKISAGAVSQTLRFTSGSGTELDGSFTALLDGDITTDGGVVLASATGYTRFEGGASAGSSTQVSFQIRRVGASGGGVSVTALPSGTAGVVLSYSCQFVDTPSAGSHTYEVVGSKTPNADLCEAFCVDLSMVELRR